MPGWAAARLTRSTCWRTWLASLFEHGKITTTEARARRLRPYAEKLITLAKRGDLHARRQVVTVTAKSPDAGKGDRIVHTLFAEIGPAMAERPGGYTRITKIGPRKGDAAPMAVIELVREEAGTSRPRRRTRRTATPAVPEAAAQSAVEAEAAADAETAADLAGAHGAETTSMRTRTPPSSPLSRRRPPRTRRPPPRLTASLRHNALV